MSEFVNLKNKGILFGNSMFKRIVFMWQSSALKLECLLQFDKVEVNYVVNTLTIQLIIYIKKNWPVTV